MSNFEFLKKVDKDLYNIAYDAEKLYRDEYFEQCMSQTRRFAEIVTQNMLKDKKSDNATFDEMLNFLKDKSKGNPREKEFIDDLYFLKQNGNKSVHSKKVQKDGITALECLQRAFEVGINYITAINGENKKILSLSFDIDLLVTGKKSTKSLSEKYNDLKEKRKKEIPLRKNNSVKKVSSKKSNKTAIKVIKNEKKEDISLFKKIFITLVITVVVMLGFLIYKQFVL